MFTTWLLLSHTPSPNAGAEQGKQQCVTQPLLLKSWHPITQVRLNVQDNQRWQCENRELCGLCVDYNRRGRDCERLQEVCGHGRKIQAVVPAPSDKFPHPEEMFGLSHGWDKLLKCLHQPRKMSQRASLHCGSWEDHELYHWKEGVKSCASWQCSLWVAWWHKHTGRQETSLLTQGFPCG